RFLIVPVPPAYGQFLLFGTFQIRRIHRLSDQCTSGRLLHQLHSGSATTDQAGVRSPATRFRNDGDRFWFLTGLNARVPNWIAARPEAGRPSAMVKPLSETGARAIRR